MVVKLLFKIVISAALLAGSLQVGADQQPSIKDLEAMRATDPTALLQLLNQGLAEIPPDADPLFVAHQFRLRAETLRDRGDYAGAREDAAEFQRHARSVNDTVLVSRALMLKGTIDAEQNNIAGALDRFHEARQLLEASDQIKELAMVNNAIGIAHNFLFDFVRARRYYEEALRLARIAGNEGLESSILGNLALAVSEIDGPEVGLPMHREALALAMGRGDNHGIALQTALICERLMEVAQLVEARATCKDALDRLSALGLSRPLAGVWMTLGTISREEGKLREAIGFYETALQHATGVVPGVVLELHLQLSEVHEERGEPGLALQHLQDWIDLREESQERENQSVIEELEVKYEVEQHEKQLELVTLESQLQEARLRLLQLVLLATAVGLGFATIFAVIAWRAYRVKAGLERELDLRNHELEEAIEQISKLARTDTLTGLWNRRAFEELAEDEMARSQRSGQPLTIVLADIDRFKALNDRYGHHAGDEVLKTLANQLRTALRGTDTACRWGGEEFLCLFPNTDTAAALQTIERLREHILNHPVNVGGEPFPITMTFGIASLYDDLDGTIREADAAMYEGKRNGRNQIVISKSVDQGPHRA